MIKFQEVTYQDYDGNHVQGWVKPTYDFDVPAVDVLVYLAPNPDSDSFYVHWTDILEWRRSMEIYHEKPTESIEAWTGRKVADLMEDLPQYTVDELGLGERDDEDRYLDGDDYWADYHWISKPREDPTLPEGTRRRLLLAALITLKPLVSPEGLEPYAEDLASLNIDLSRLARVYEYLTQVALAQTNDTE